MEGIFAKAVDHSGLNSNNKLYSYWPSENGAIHHLPPPTPGHSISNSYLGEYGEILELHSYIYTVILYYIDAEQFL